jgi:uncharacterized protein YbjT (DUF2867 family)
MASEGRSIIMILVTTAGKVGSETARLLIQREVPVRVLVRDPSKAKAKALATTFSSWAGTAGLTSTTPVTRSP